MQNTWPRNRLHWQADSKLHRYSNRGDVAVTLAGISREEYDGSSMQAPGTYFVLNYNLGELHFVSETGMIHTPANGTALSVSYSRVANVYAFDTDLPAGIKLEEHWDNFLFRYGLRKNEVESQRYHGIDFGLMKGELMASIEQARQFSEYYALPGTDLDSAGSLGRIREVPNFKASAPGAWLDNSRLLLGKKGVTHLRMMKPFSIGVVENVRGPSGRFTGQKAAYGDQFVAIHTPSPFKGAYTSFAVYSGTRRVARVEQG